MKYPSDLLSALNAVLTEGSFDAAARKLHITPSAISQRIRTLEERAGQALVLRTQPATATEAGKILYRLARDCAELEREASDALSQTGTDAPLTIHIAANADSLATWLIPILAGFVFDNGDGALIRPLYDVKVEDQDHTVDLLKSGGVHALITTEPKAQAACRVVPLGKLRYHAVCSPTFFAKHFSHGLNEHSFAQAPMLMFNQKDQLQYQYMKKFTSAQLTPPIHYLPSVHAFVGAPLLDMGWCMSVSPLCQTYLDNGLLRDIAPDVYLDVPLYWQYSTLPTKWLQQLTQYIEQNVINAQGLITSS